MPKSTKSSKKDAKSSTNGLVSSSKFDVRKLGIIAAILAVIGIAFVVLSHASAVAPVPCSAIGGGKYNCGFYETTPVVNAAGAQVGTEHVGTNWVLCQLPGRRITIGSYTNIWWAYTLSDQNTYGWVNAVYGKGGANDGAWRGVPSCSTAHGLPPQPIAAPVKTPVATATPAPHPVAVAAPAPAPVPCSSIGAGHYNCSFYPYGSPVQNGSSTAGYIHQGTNWIICQQSGGEVSYSGYRNKWWGYTQADNGAFGWVSALFGNGGANDGAFSAAPSCNNAHGAVPTVVAAISSGSTSSTGSGGSGGGQGGPGVAVVTPSTPVCGTGTHLRSGECLNDATGVVVPPISPRCSTGTHYVNGECLNSGGTYTPAPIPPVIGPRALPVLNLFSTSIILPGSTASYQPSGIAKNGRRYQL